MAWVDPVTLQHQHGHLQGIYPAWNATLRAEYSDTYVDDAIYYDARMSAAWEGAKAQSPTYIHGGAYGWAFRMSASGNFSNLGDPLDGIFSAMQAQTRQVYQVAPDGDLLDQIMEARWLEYVAAEGLVQGVDYDTPPPSERYKTYDWKPVAGGATVLPGGYIGLASWGGSQTSAPPGYWGGDLEIRTWPIDTSSLPALPRAQTAAPPWVNEDIPDALMGDLGYQSTGTLLWSFEMGQITYEDANQCAMGGDWRCPDSMYPMDISALTDANGRLALNHTTPIHDNAMPPTALYGFTPPSDGDGMSSMSKTVQVYQYIHIIPRLYPLVEFQLQYWEGKIPPLRLRARDDDTATPTSGAEPGIRIGTGPTGTREKSASVQRSPRIFYGPNTYA